MSSPFVVVSNRCFVAATIPIIIFVILTLVPTSISVGLKYSGGNSIDPLGPLTQCTMSEYACNNRKCISMNKFCDNQNDCGDGSDEPRFCTPCNRTYYGNVGLTYQLELHRPKEDKIPYVCILTFMASGGLHGDIVQVTIDSFTLGRFVSYTTDGCPDGFLQISESSRTPVGGMWCGTSWGPVMFFSETRSLILAIKLWRLSRDQNGYNFDFRVHYKVLPRESAVVRYGGIKYEEITSWTNYTNLQSSLHVLDEFTNSTAYSEELGSDNTVNSVNSNSLFYDKDNNNNKDKDGNVERDRQISLINSNKYSITNSTSYGIQNSNLSRNSNSSSSSHGTHPNFTVPKYYLGDLIQGTYCSRIFSDCDKKACRLQSPNFPGIYPRNLTCYYAIRQHEVPIGKHALIIVRQPKGNLVWISTQTILNTKNDKEKFVPTINTWDECDNVQDYITIYDGYTIRDPVILKFCGGGQSVPSSISSGPELLVEFTTSPYGTFITQQSSVQSLHGFQLEVEVKFLDQQSPTYSKSKRNCEFWLTGTGHGVLESPKHSLPPNTTCLYHLHGTEGSFRPLDQMQIPRRMSSASYTQPVTRFRIWISILKFNFASQFGLVEENLGIMQPTEDCTGMLRIWDGPLREPPICKDVNCERDINNKPILVKYGQNFTNVLARFCRGTVPKSCDHGLLNETKSRPCLMSESFLSSSDFVTLELKNIESTVLRPLNFRLRYEFIDLLQDGLPIDTEHECNRRFASSLIERRDPGVVRSVRNVFLFGRGGATDLHCIYRFEGQRGERVRLVVRKIMTGNRTCGSKIDADINRSYCFGDSTIKLEIFEHPFSDSILFPRGCVCNSSINGQAHAPVIYMSTSREVEIHFTAINMTALDDPDNVNFEATFEFFKGPTTCRDSRRKSGSSGVVDLSVGDLECRTRPWLIEPNNGKSLYIRLNGLYLRRYNPLVQIPLNTSIRTTTPTRCTTKARVVITTGEGIQITSCPLNAEESTRHFVEVFSAGWNRKVDYQAKEPSQIISVEFLEPEDGDFQFTWLELTKIPPQGLLGGVELCLYKCPELDACINASVWCDGKSHCPSGYDESFTHCSALLRLPPEILATLCAFIVLLCCGIIGFIFRKIKRKCRRSSVLQTRLKSLSSMDTAVFDEKDVIC